MINQLSNRDFTTIRHIFEGLRYNLASSVVTEKVGFEMKRNYEVYKFPLV